MAPGEKSVGCLVCRPSIRKGLHAASSNHKDVVLALPARLPSSQLLTISRHREHRPISRPSKYCTEVRGLASAPCTSAQTAAVADRLMRAEGEPRTPPPLLAWHYRCCSSPLFRTPDADETGSPLLHLPTLFGYCNVVIDTPRRLLLLLTQTGESSHMHVCCRYAGRSIAACMRWLVKASLVDGRMQEQDRSLPSQQHHISAILVPHRRHNWASSLHGRA